MVRISTRFLVAISCLIVLTLITHECAAFDDPNVPDTVAVDSVVADFPLACVVPVHFFNDEPLDGVEIVLTCSSSDIRVDSFSFVGGRLQSTGYTGSILADNAVIAFAYPNVGGPIPEGNGLLGRVFLSYDPDLSDRLATIDTTTIYMSDSLVVHSTYFSPTDLPGQFTPVYRPGFLDIHRCCVGFTGNTDCDSEQKLNLSDVTRLIDFIYLTRTPLCCWSSGNTTGDSEGIVNLSDVTRLIDRIYLSKRATAPCP